MVPFMELVNLLIDLLTFLQQNLDRALSLHNFILDVRFNQVALDLQPRLIPKFSCFAPPADLSLQTEAITTATTTKSES